MPAPLLNQRDLDFMLYELFNVEAVTSRERYADRNRETFDAAIATARVVAEKGIKGISLFIVPKFLVNDDGSLGERNEVTLAGLFHKMGGRGQTSCALNFGEQDGAVAYLLVRKTVV